MLRSPSARTAAAEVEAVLGERTGRECLLFPSGRMALHCGLRAELPAGSGILMSPVNDDVIFFTVLAAGLRPVAAPLSPEDGNIDVDAVPESAWSGVGGVLTTNLYGLPDDVLRLRERCDRHGLRLVEDAAHALENEIDGAAIGSFGDVAAFSLSKHAQAGCGGVLALSDPSRRRELEAMRDRMLARRDPSAVAREVLGPHARRAIRALGLRGAVRRVHGGRWRPERDGHRMDLRAPALRQALAASPDLAGFDPWVRVDGPDYRARPRRHELTRMCEALRRVPADRVRRRAGVERLREELDLLAPAARRGPATPLFRVPLLVADRDGAAAELEHQGMDVHYVYDPPLDDYAGPEFMEPSPSPEAARWWARHVLPVDPLLAERVIAALRGAPAAPPLAPATGAAA